MVVACEDGADDFDVSVLDDADHLLDEAATHFMSWVRWTVPQLALLGCVDPYYQLRTGNQFGKTWAGCGEVIFRCLGQHPYKRVRPPPIEAWIVCKSWSQSIAIQKKLWTLLPKDELVPGTTFSEKNGFAGVQKAVEFRNGSVIRIKTIGQDTMDLESATIHLVWIDEPLGDDGTFSALQMRLRRTGGHIMITQTPATSGDLTWLRKLCESGQMRDLHFRMEAANFIPEGSAEPLMTMDPDSGELVPMDQAWCDAERAKTFSWQRGVRCDGEWQYENTEKALEAFNREKHVRDLLGADRGLLPARVQISDGIDLGEDALRTCGVHVYVDTSGQHPRVFVVSEYVPQAATTVEMDAAGLVEMQRRAGDTWADLDYAWCDKRYEGRTTKKSAANLAEAVATHLGLRDELDPGIRVAKRGLKRDHFWDSVKWLHATMMRPDCFYVDESCAWLIEAIEKWNGKENHIYKDVIDALRYALRHLWGARRGAPERKAPLQRRF